MRNLMIVAALGMMLAGVGCKSSMHKDEASTQSSTPMKMDAGKDECPMCEGTQHANADGKCPKCGMALKQKS